MLARRSLLPVVEQAALSALIVQRLLAAKWVNHAQVLMAYLPTRGEVDLTELLDFLEASGVTLVLPKVTSRRTREMKPIAVPSPWRKQVALGPLGILEPTGGTVLYTQAIDVLLVPGVAFDSAFFRLGFGGGYYDRFLPRLPSSTLLCGIAYAFQVVPHLAHDPHDVPLHALCTEKECLLARPDVY
jgi:5-formyltetrahydrofolate cyclo-ligase